MKNKKKKSQYSDQPGLSGLGIAKDLRLLHADSEDCSDWADTQADPSLCWVLVILLILSCSASYCLCTVGLNCVMILSKQTDWFSQTV